MGEERGDRTHLLHKHPAWRAEPQQLGKVSTLSSAQQNYLQIEKSLLPPQPFAHQHGVKSKS